MPKLWNMVACLFLIAAGCGGSSQPPTPAQEQESKLSQVGEMYRSYQMAKNKSPEKFSDFTSVRAVSGNGYEAVRSGEVVLRYGATLPDIKEEPGQSSSDEVLAYEKDVPSKGGNVLLLNRTVKAMTADEFKSAKMAGKDAGSSRAAAKK